MPAVEHADPLVATFAKKVYAPREVRDLPDPPRNYWRLVGPGIVAGGVGLSSGEFVLWPFIASQVGLILLWGALVGVVTQFFLNMEVERYTLATGETAVTGFNRFWKHWGLVFAVLVLLRESVARMGDQLRDAGELPVRRQPDHDRDRQPARHRLLADVRAGHLRGARAADLRQSRGGADSRRPRHDVRDRARVVARAARRDARASAGFPKGSASR